MKDNTFSNISLKNIYFLKFISTFTFGIFYSSLTLLISNKFAFTSSESSGLVGMFFGLHYILPLIGGRLGDKTKNFNQLFLLGKIFQLMGIIFLIRSITYKQYFFLGLGMFLVDSMVNTVAINMFITDHFMQDKVQERRTAFLNSHIWANFGFIVAFICSGIVYTAGESQLLLYLALGFSIITVLCSFYCLRSVKQSYTGRDTSNSKVLLMMMGIGFLASAVLNSYILSRNIIIITVMIMLFVVILHIVRSSSKVESSSVLKFFIFVLFSVIFWTIDMLAPVFIPAFIDAKVNMYLFGLKVPPQWFQLLNPLTTVAAGTVVYKLVTLIFNGGKREANSIKIFTVGMFFVICALFIILYISSNLVNGMQINQFWIIVYIILLTLSEILIAPTMMGLVGEYIPRNYQGLFTGINQVSIGVSVILAGMLSEYILIPFYTQRNLLSANYGYFILSLILAIFCMCILMIMFDNRLSNRDNILATK